MYIYTPTYFKVLYIHYMRLYVHTLRYSDFSFLRKASYKISHWDDPVKMSS